ncbi:methyltransferase domain-containing protein [Gynuella sp.]|uniref:methyltransferase domain-containing protein n=1 Tax=Gynuella sp. TaxID=2969146 RepID=UPI003D0B4A0E
MQDVNFDPLVDRFKANIFDSLKGRIRRAVILDRLQNIDPFPGVLEPTVADIGGGFGDMSLHFASHGATVDYFDLSENMAAMMRDRLGDYPQYLDKVTVRNGRFQDMIDALYDLVHCQAVLEWLADPWQGLKILCDSVRPGGYLLLTFYNRDSIIFKNLIKGNFRKAFSEEMAGDARGLTPIHPLDKGQVFDFLGTENMVIEKWFGVRSFSDYLYPHVNKQNPKIEKAILDAELKVCEREPYRSLARYIGVIARRQS